ncbi:MAG: capsule assembly Wzi family protein [Janthinobacterium lividum]
MNKLFPFFVFPVLLCSFLCRPVYAAATDIVPQGSTLLDSFAALAQANAFGAEETPEDFLGDTLYTRGQLARLLAHLVQDDPAHLGILEKNAAADAALHSAIETLHPELSADKVDLSDADPAPTSRAASLSGYLQPELRLRTGGDYDPGTGVNGVYRLTALGNLRSNLRYAVSASNWPEDSRRVFDNDKGPHDFSALNEAYLTLDGGRGLEVNLGRMYNRWGPGTRGATMVSDNAPALDQLQVAFPFSLGARFGHDYRFTQFISTFQQDNVQRYFAGRRIEYAFNPRLTADFQEAYVSSSSQSLYVSLLPDFYSGQSANLKIGGLRIQGLDQTYNSFLNLGLSYEATTALRVYGQLGIDDLQSPGHQSYRTPRKVAQLAGVAFQPGPGTGIVAEYTFADPTTYSSRSVDTQWQKGQYDELGLPSGPNSRELFLRLSRRLHPGLTVALQERDRRRVDDNFPAPNSRDYAASVEFSPNQHNSIELTYHDYRQDAFPISPSVPSPGDGFTPANAEGNYGQTERIKQLDLDYRFFF